MTVIARWKSWLRQLTLKSSQQQPREARLELAQAIQDAKVREAGYKLLFEQLAFALQAAESRIPIDRQTVPLNLPLGPSKIKELAAQLKLSTFLRSNIEALLFHFRENQRDLRNAEKAANLLTDHPSLKVRPEAIALVRELFQFMGASREKFRDYPLFFQLLTDSNDGDDASFTPIPEELQYLLTQADAPDLPEGQLGLLESATEVSSRGSGTGRASLANPILDVVVPPALLLEVGLDLLPLIDPSLGSDFFDKVAEVREELAQTLGLVLPAVQLRYNEALPQGCYAFQIRGNTVGNGDIMAGYHLAVPLDPTETLESEFSIVGFPTHDSVTGHTALWVTRQEGRRAARCGYDVIETAQVLVRHLKEIAYGHAAEILSLEDVNATLNHLRERIPVTIETLIPDKLDIADYHLILKNLLRERVSVRDQITILECLNHKAKPPHPFYLMDRFGDGKATMESLMLLELSAQIRPLTDASVLSELVRQGLSRQICEALTDAQATIDVVSLSGAVEAVIAEAIRTHATGQSLQLPAAKSEWLVGRVLAECHGKAVPVLICDARIRPFVKQLTSRALPKLQVLARTELHPDYRIHVVGTISPTDP